MESPARQMLSARGPLLEGWASSSISSVVERADRINPAARLGADPAQKWRKPRHDEETSPVMAAPVTGFHVAPATPSSPRVHSMQDPMHVRPQSMPSVSAHQL